MNIHAFRVQKQAEIGTIQKKIARRKKRFIIVGIVFSVSLVLAFFMMIQVGKTSLEKQYSDYMNLSLADAASVEVNDELMRYKDVSHRREAATLGNLNGNLMNYGKYLSSDDVVAIDAPDGLKVTYQGADIMVTRSSASYLNLMDGVLYFRDDQDFCVWMYSFSSKQKEKLIDGRIGQVVVSRQGVYYLDLSNNNSLVFMPVGSEKELLTTDFVKVFAVQGRIVLYLDKDNTLKKIDRTNGTTEIVIENVRNFTLSKEMIIENNGDLVESAIDKLSARKLYDGNVQLLNATADCVLFVENEELFTLDRDMLVTASYGKVPWIVLSAYLTDDDILLYGFTKDANGIITAVHTSVKR